MLLTQLSCLTICGLDELAYHARGVTHVLSILDPEWPEPQAFWAYDCHHRTTLHFHDAILDRPNIVLPQREHVEAILEFGHSLANEAWEREARLLVHCHAGLSRSTAAMAVLLAQAHPEEDERSIFARLREIRLRAWPNSLMIGFADDALGREGRLMRALGQHYSFQLKQYPEIEEQLRQAGRTPELAMADVP